MQLADYYKEYLYNDFRWYL